MAQNFGTYFQKQTSRKEDENFWTGFFDLINFIKKTHHLIQKLSNKSSMPENQLNSTPINQNQVQQNQNAQIPEKESETIHKESVDIVLKEQGEMNFPASHQNNQQADELEERYDPQPQNHMSGDKIILQNQQGQVPNNTNPTSTIQNHANYENNQYNQSETKNNPPINDQPLIIEDQEVKILEDGYNYEPTETQGDKNHQNQQLKENHQLIEEEKPSHTNELQQLMIENGPVLAELPYQSQQDQQMYEPHIKEVSQYNSYVQSVLNGPINPTAQPSHEALQEIYNELKVQFPQCLPEQIILLLYNNLIKIPREEMMEEEGEQFDELLKYDGGKRYVAQLNAGNSKVELFNFQLRKQMVKVYVTKGYGLKVYQQHMATINPQAPPIDKEKFKSHFVNIYKIIIKRIQQFLTNTADRQFEPMTKTEFHKTLGDVINCRKNYPPEFCDVFFRIVQATFDADFDKDKIPNQKEVAFFYRTILSKVREQNVILAKKLHQPEEEKDTDIWSQQFEFYFIKLFIVSKKISQAKIRLIEKYPECDGLLTDEKLKQKIENAIRIATRWLQTENQNCGNLVAFTPSDIDRRFIMRAPELEESRIKLLKVYVKKPNDPQVLSSIVSFIHKQLQAKYGQERIPPEALQRSTVKQLPRNEQLSGLQKIIKAQIIKTS